MKRNVYADFPSLISCVYVSVRPVCVFELKAQSNFHWRESHGDLLKMKGYIL